MSQSMNVANYTRFQFDNLVRTEWVVYVEYENVANANNAVSIPTITASDDLTAYYSGLALSATRDYVRQGAVSTTGLKSDNSLTYNDIVRFVALVAETTGVHGKPFSQSSISKVCGVALAKVNDPDDPLQDLILLRGYFSSQEQKIATANAPLVIPFEWQIAFN